MSKESKKAYDQNIKLLLLGDSGVGKTSLMMRFADDTFTSTFVSTVGIDFKYKVITIDPNPNKGDSKVNLRLELWDTAGQERFKSITASYLRGAQGILICYDVTDRKSFDRVDNWMQDIQQFADLQVTLVLVGTKIDLVSTRKVLPEEGQALADAHGIPFFECSAKDRQSVDVPFLALSKKVYLNLKALNMVKEKGVILKPAEAKEESEEKGGCC